MLFVDEISPYFRLKNQKEQSNEWEQAILSLFLKVKEMKPPEHFHFIQQHLL